MKDHIIRTYNLMFGWFTVRVTFPTITFYKGNQPVTGATNYINGEVV